MSSSSSVHEAITRHVLAQNQHLTAFMQLDEQREQAIERALELCRAGLPFSVDEINRITGLINAHAANGISPQRINVTDEMVREYAGRS